jgi:hypothetical protein
MKCPHCLVEVHLTWEDCELGTDNEYNWRTSIATCPHCQKYIIFLQQYSPDKLGNLNFIKDFLVYPKGIYRAPLSPVVPDIYAQEYKEACLVLSYSAKASAALSRRCLQNILMNVQKVKSKDLSKEIDEVLELKVLPYHLAEAIDAIRNIGNFAAHPNKSTNTGTIIDVETGEAEWLLDVLESLFDFYFVQPDILLKKKATLNQKLKDAGKPAMQ